MKDSFKGFERFDDPFEDSICENNSLSNLFIINPEQPVTFSFVKNSKEIDARINNIKKYSQVIKDIIINN